MNIRLLKKLRKQAKEKYCMEIHAINDKVIDYRVVQKYKNETKVLFHHDYIDKAIDIRDKLRRNDILKNVGIIRYEKVLKKYNRWRDFVSKLLD